LYRKAGEKRVAFRLEGGKGGEERLEELKAELKRELGKELKELEVKWDKVIEEMKEEIKA